MNCLGGGGGGGYFESECMCNQQEDDMDLVSTVHRVPICFRF